MRSLLGGPALVYPKSTFVFLSVHPRCCRSVELLQVFCKKASCYPERYFLNISQLPKASPFSQTKFLHSFSLYISINFFSLQTVGQLTYCDPQNRLLKIPDFSEGIERFKDFFLSLIQSSSHGLDHFFSNVYNYTSVSVELKIFIDPKIGSWK